MPERPEPAIADLVPLILEQAFGDADAARSVSPLPGGSINTTFAIDLRDRPGVILRIAPSAATAAAGPSWLSPWGLRREQAVIALATPALGSLLPKMIASDFDRTFIDRDWIIQERMRGVQLSTIDAALPPGERTALWTELGQLTRRLHATAGERFGPPVAGPQFDRLSDLLANDADGLLDDAGRFDLPAHPFRRIRERVDELAGIFDDNPGPRLVHSDLSRSHVFVDRGADASDQLHVVGIIDLEFGRFADPRFERLITSFQWGNARLEMAGAFFAGYGPSFDTPEDRLCLRVYVALALAWSATILAFHHRWEAVPGVIAQMEDVLSLRNGAAPK